MRMNVALMVAMRGHRPHQSAFCKSHAPIRMTLNRPSCLLTNHTGDKEAQYQSSQANRALPPLWQPLQPPPTSSEAVLTLATACSRAMTVTAAGVLLRERLPEARAADC